MNLKNYLQERQDNWAAVGSTNLLIAFLLRNGQPFKAAPFKGRRMEPKQCFSNAFDYADARFGVRYVEGFAIHAEHSILELHHAWATDDGETVIDPTLAEPEKYAFFGMPFDVAFVRKEILRKGFYGLFDSGFGFDIDLMIRLDPGMAGEVEKAGQMMRESAQRFASAVGEAS